jgi:hypothetical protein
MYERSTRGVKYQLTGLNLWVVALVLGFGLTVLADSFFGFVLAFAILVLVVVGLVLFIVGLVFILLGGKEAKNTSWVVSALLLLILSPFVIMGGIFNVHPMNYIIGHLGMWMLLASLVLPYIKMGGMITGIIALILETVMLIYTLSVILAGRLGITMPLLMSLIGAYFLFLEFSIIISYLKLKNMQSKIQIVEGKAPSDVELDRGPRPTGRPPGREPAQRAATSPFGPGSSSTEGTASAFRVLEYEFPRATPGRGGGPERDPFMGVPTANGTPRVRKEPVVGRALNFEEAVKRTETAFAKKKAEPKKDEKYTVEDEEEIDISFEDLYIDGQTLYDILKIEKGASANSIKKAYRKRAILFHPDKNRDMGPLYAETIGMEMRKLNTAKAILLDPAKRSIYDKMLDSVT